METNQEILIKATKTYGCLKQSEMMQEECAELIQAISKMKRKDGISHNEIRKPLQTDSQDYVLAYHNLCGEVADVRILIKQMESMLCNETIDLIEQRKIDRLGNRLSKHLENEPS